MLPLELYLSDEMEPRRKKAIAKALDLNPPVVKLADGPMTQFYSVNQYTVQILQGPDDVFGECTCLASSPPLDEATGLPKYEPTICYHLSSVLLHIAEQEKNNDKRRNRTGL